MDCVLGVLGYVIKDVYMCGMFMHLCIYIFGKG